MAQPTKKPVKEINESLDVYNDPPNATVDIVAIPGLGANPVQSWQSIKPPGTFNWITEKKTTSNEEAGISSKGFRDVAGLAKDCPNARVLLYNYASAYQGDYKIEQHMYNIVGIFLDQLKAKREENPRRPLVLLGHSMGGLVIAKALLVTESRRHDYPDMYEAISGCVFFGTPFNGAPVADIAHQWATINERLGKAIDSQLITLLQPGNDTLKELKDEFVRSVNKLGMKIQVHCFWESLDTRWESLIAKLASQEFPASSLGRLDLPECKRFVSEESATLPGMRHTSLPRAHRDLVRFESDKDPVYQLVKAPLREIVNAAPRVAKARFNDARRSSINPTMWRDILEMFDGAEPKLKWKALQQKSTSEIWIVRDKVPLFVDWLENPTRDTDYLWIHGPEGKGKSTAAAAIITAINERIRRLEHEHSDQSPQLLAYFFCETTPDYCTAEDVVKSLLRQLCQQQEILATYATHFLKSKLDQKERPKASLSIENLWQCLEEMFSEGTLGTIYFVINNLNELQESPSKKKLLSFIQDDIKRMSSSRPRAKKIRTKWLITSRSHKAMENIFSSNEVRNIDLDDAKYGNQQQQALRKYAWTKVEDLQKTKGYTMAMKYLTGSVIGNRADNTKWIDVAVVQLAAAESSEIKVQKMLENVPRDFKSLLNGAWRSILKRDDEDMETIRELLRALVLTYEDPREQELLVLAGLSTHSKHDNAEVKKLVSKCQPLVTTRTVSGDTFIGFVNVDVKKHLLDHSMDLLDIGDEWTKWQHGKMSLRCFSHIVDALREGTQKMRSETPEADTKAAEEQSSNITEPRRRSEIQLDEDGPSGDARALEAEGGGPAPPVTPSDTKGIGPRLALDYATRYWLRHASEATLDVAEIISREKLFWEPGSAQRQRWLEEYHALTNSLLGFEFRSWKALHVTASVGFPHLVTALINEGHGEEVNEYDSLYNKPIHLSAFFGNVDVLELLLKARSPVDDTGDPGDKVGMGPLTMAAYNGQTEVMRKLIVDWKANINALYNEGPVLNAAILSGNTDAVKLLLEHEVRINYGMDEVEVAPLAMSAYYSDLKMFSTILEKTKNKLTPEEFDKAMIWASAAGNLDVLRVLLPFEHEHEAYQFSLLNATHRTKWDACLLILKHPAARGLDCEGLLTHACAEIANETLVEVIQACWDNSNKSLSQEVLDQCLYEATDKEKESAVKLLRKLGASPDAKGKKFGNSLTASANDGTERILSFLLDAGANPNSPDGYALQQASSQGHLKIVETLLSRGADVNNVSEMHPSRTALQAACNSGHVKVTKLLLKWGANPNLGGGDNTRPIFGAVLDGGEVLNEILRAPRLELDTVGGPYNGSPLATAAYHLPAEKAGLILDYGASVDFIDNDGDTALMAAARVGDEACLRLLLEKGADFLKVSKRNETALQTATELNHVECANLLLARTDFLLRELQSAAEQGNEHSQQLIASEKRGRHDAMAKEAVLAAEAKAKTAEAPEASSSNDVSKSAGLAGDSMENGPDTAKASEQSPDGDQPLRKAEDPGVKTPAVQASLENDDIGHDEPSGYPTPARSMMGDDHTEEDGNSE